MINTRRSIEETMEAIMAQAQETVRLESPVKYSLPWEDRDFEGEKRSLTHPLAEVQRQMEELRVEEQTPGGVSLSK